MKNPLLITLTSEEVAKFYSDKAFKQSVENQLGDPDDVFLAVGKPGHWFASDDADTALKAAEDHNDPQRHPR